MADIKFNWICLTKITIMAGLDRHPWRWGGLSLKEETGGKSSSLHFEVVIVWEIGMKGTHWVLIAEVWKPMQSMSLEISRRPWEHGVLASRLHFLGSTPISSSTVRLKYLAFSAAGFWSVRCGGWNVSMACWRMKDRSHVKQLHAWC